MRGARGLDVGDTVRLTLVVADAEKGFIDFAHEVTDAERKLERSRRKKAAADLLRPLVGQLFEAQVSGVSESGTYVRLLDGRAEGRVVRGYRTLTVGMQVPVRLVATDSVHGFIDFEYVTAADAEKDARLARKRAAASMLEDQVGELFDAVVTGASRKATWILVQSGDVEGRLVRGRHGLTVGSALRVVLLTADPVRGFIDFAADMRA
ncbi:hypothetical protein BH11GEM1_BH11GEM1_21870 [soil metagenome]